MRFKPILRRLWQFRLFTSVAVLTLAIGLVGQSESAAGERANVIVAAHQRRRSRRGAASE
jgi:hypothetical protein